MSWKSASQDLQESILPLPEGGTQVGLRDPGTGAWHPQHGYGAPAPRPEFRQLSPGGHIFEQGQDGWSSVANVPAAAPKDFTLSPGQSRFRPGESDPYASVDPLERFPPGGGAGGEDERRQIDQIRLLKAVYNMTRNIEFADGSKLGAKTIREMMISTEAYVQQDMDIAEAIDRAINENMPPAATKVQKKQLRDIIVKALDSVFGGGKEAPEHDFDVYMDPDNEWMAR